MNPVVNIFTVDLEEWFHASLLENCSVDRDAVENQRVEEVTGCLLSLLNRFDVRATFFVLGWVAQHYPQLVAQIKRQGHEIATHGYGHKMLPSLSPERFEEDLVKSLDYIEEAAGVRPLGYRAPSWSVNHHSRYIFHILKRHGIQYDSSVFPVKNFLYGMPDAPRFPFTLSQEEGGLIEIPMSTVRVASKNIPFSGGFYFRALPIELIQRAFRMTNSIGQPAILYIHPHDIDPKEPRVTELSIRDALIHNYGVTKNYRKLEKILEQFSFCSISEYLATHTLPCERPITADV